MELAPYFVAFSLLCFSFVSLHFDLILTSCGGNKWYLIVGHSFFVVLCFFFHIENLKHVLFTFQLGALLCITVVNGIMYDKMEPICKKSTWGSWSLAWALFFLVILALGLLCSFIFTVFVEIRKKILDRNKDVIIERGDLRFSYIR